MKPALALSEDELGIVRAILRKHLPARSKVFAFGSRATGQAKPWSDLDLVIDAGTQLELAALAEMSEAFDESALPWKVDLVDRRNVSPEFGDVIDAAKSVVM